MNTAKDFTDETEAGIFRDTKRQEGLAASLFTYGKDRYRVKVWEKWETHPKRTQRGLSNSAWEVSDDIEDLTKIKELIADPDFGYEIEDVVFVAKKLNKERWFNSPDDVIGFFDGISAEALTKIKDMVDTALNEYDEEWNDKESVEVKAE